VSDHVTGQCHCGTVKFEAELDGGFDKAMRCTCSLCRMRGAVVVLAKTGDFRITAGADYVAEYQFNTRVAHHYFCKTCGVYTHHQRRFDPNQYAINAACLDGVSPFDFTEVRVVDGVNHPLDNDGVLHTAGWLRYTARGNA
jgi:hypothetical protein